MNTSLLESFAEGYDPCGSEDVYVDRKKGNLVAVDTQTGQKRVLTDED
jgi:hypothetical protein